MAEEAEAGATIFHGTGSGAQPWLTVLSRQGKIDLSTVAVYLSNRADEESLSAMRTDEEERRERYEAFSLKRRATIGVCVYAAAMASTMIIDTPRPTVATARSNH
jgi:hypothetical protein